MKALSVRQPWAFLIVNGLKDIENRTWHTNFRGRVLIHAGKTLDPTDTIARECEEMGIILPSDDELALGGIVGIATVVDCVERSASPWYNGPFGFVLADSKPLPFFPLRGKLSFFDCPE